MPTPIISVENLSKRYLVGHRIDENAPFQYATLRDVVARGAHNVSRKAADVLRGRQVVQGDTIEEFWALKNVSFEVNEGEVLGIIGRNGAGKSTLLKILSRIAEPTAGRITLRGRVASLLEVGTGFHPELSGRENILLNGAILGMSRAEIRGKFDEIIAFAEVERFLDTPVKRYSSGMYVRLAFAIAAHLEPEILVIDEVLAVGDAEFQQKCLAKMDEVSRRDGRTVLFVSHNMPAVERLSAAAILLQDGQIRLRGDAPMVVDTYLRDPRLNATAADLRKLRPAWAKEWITGIRIVDDDGVERGTFGLGESLTVEVQFSGDGVLRRPVLGVTVKHRSKGTVGGATTRMTGYQPPHSHCSSGLYRCRLKRPPLLQGEYSIDAWLGDGPDDVDMVADAADFTIEERDLYQSGVAPFRTLGMIYFEPSWSLERRGAPAKVRA